jgi:glycosyltransferase involved in cell wall biosynthesis
MSARPRVMHVITGLSTGGAELILARALESLGPGEFDSRVLSLTTLGTVGPQIRELGVEVSALGEGHALSPARLFGLRRALAAFEPDVVQTWLLHANVLGGLVARTRPGTPVVWGVHITDVRREIHGSVAVATRRLEKALSHRVPARIVACSESSARVMRELRYPEDKLVTIPNGFDVSSFRPDRSDRKAVRSELGIAEDALVVGHVARFHPMKDHHNLVEAAVRLQAEIPSFDLVLCGEGVTMENPELANWLSGLGEGVRVHALGRRADVQRLYRAFDVVAVSSVGAEALPLVIGESMASAVPVVATDCGDARELIGAADQIVPVSDAPALAAALARVLQLGSEEREALGRIARERIERKFSLEKMSQAYGREWRLLAA